MMVTNKKTLKAGYFLGGGVLAFGRGGSLRFPIIYGCFLKWWYPHFTPPKWSFLVGKPMVVGYHHFRKQPYVGSTPHPGWPNGAGGNPRVTVTNVSALILVTIFVCISGWGGEAQIFRYLLENKMALEKPIIWFFFKMFLLTTNWWFSIVMLVFGGVHVLCKITILFPFPCRARLKKALKIRTKNQPFGEYFCCKTISSYFYHGIHHHELSHHLGKYLPNSCHPTVRKIAAFLQPTSAGTTSLWLGAWKCDESTVVSWWMMKTPVSK